MGDPFLSEVQQLELVKAKTTVVKGSPVEDAIGACHEVTNLVVSYCKVLACNDKGAALSTKRSKLSPLFMSARDGKSEL